MDTFGSSLAAFASSLLIAGQFYRFDDCCAHAALRPGPESDPKVARKVARIEMRC